MKIFKISLVSSETNISVFLEKSTTGYVLPNLPGRNTICKSSLDERIYFVTVDDIAEENPNNFIFHLTGENLLKEITDHINYSKLKFIEECYQSEKVLREKYISKYHISAMVAGTYKYNQALEYITNNSSSVAELRNEADSRGITVLTLANKIIDNHTSFMQTDTKISSLRGKMVDRLNNFTINENDPVTSLINFHQTEIIGKRTFKFFNYELNADKIIEKPIVVGYFEPHLILRYENL